MEKIISGKTTKIHIWFTTDGENIPIKEDIYVILQVRVNESNYIE